MKDELVRKIQHVLDRPITNEMQVVYLLVEMRKLMDREAYKDQVLRMFCNWIVHTSLENRAEGSTLILREFDDLMTRIFERKERLPHFEHVSFRAFREALMRCFESFGLSAKFIKDIDHWEKLFNLYSSIVGDCPIVFRASKMKLKYINRVDLRGVGYGPVIKQWPILQWRLTLNDGKTMNWAFTWGERAWIASTHLFEGGIMRRPIARIQLHLLIALSVAVLSLVACKRNGDRPVHTEMPEAQPRVTIVYDRMYSNVAVTGYLTMHPCPSQSSEMCEHNARDQESAFYAKFATAFQFVPACSGLSLIALDSPGGDSPNTTEKLFRVPTKAQWKLNVSFTPGHEKQAWSMAPMTKLNNSSGEGDAHSMAQTVCLIAKEAGGQVVE